MCTFAPLLRVRGRGKDRRSSIPSMLIAKGECDERWRRRIARAEELQGMLPSAGILHFYHSVLQFQTQLSQRFQRPVVPASPVRDQIDLEALSLEMTVLLDLSAAQGPELLRFASGKLRDAGRTVWVELLRAAVSSQNCSVDAVQDFYARACLQPVAENLQLQLAKDPNYVGSVCPACGGLPQMAMLKPEGEGAGRSLLCSFCLGEWPFRRLICAFCGEEEKERLPRFSSDEFGYMHVEPCETCKHYLKVVDLSVNGLAVPLVDEAALAVLDVWAARQGYTKIARNIVGF